MDMMSEQEKRMGMGSELADIEMRQRAIVQLNPKIGALLDGEPREEWSNLVVEDEKNLRLIETTMTNFGVRVEPKPFTRDLTQLVENKFQDADASLLEKMGAYSLLKQAQVMCGHIVHKSVQLAKPDVKEALGMFEGVQASMAKQMGQISGIMEKVGTERIMGEEPASGMVNRLRDAAAAVAGAVMSKTAKPADEMSVLNVLRMDHAKAKTLVQEISKSTDPLDKNDLFYQLKLDLSAHSEAEEQTVYAHYRAYPDIAMRFQESWSEHDELRTVLDMISNLDPASELFRTRMGDLRELLNQHVDKEEDELFKLMQAKSDEAELQQLAANFIKLKGEIQERLSPHVADRSDEQRPSAPSAGL